MVSLTPTPYSDLNGILDYLVQCVRQALADSLVGVYLQGSFAVGDFDRHSDVDFLIVIENELCDSQLSALQDVHAVIYDQPCRWAQHLEGSYLSSERLRKLTGLPQPLWYIDNGSRFLEPSAHDDTLVVRWSTREHGIALWGPPAKTLIDSVPPSSLKHEVRATMRDWGRALLDSPEQMNNQWYQAYAVLSYCRMLHTLKTVRIDSKRAGARWARSALDGRWAGLIERAWEARPDPSVKIRLRADPDDWRATQDFIQYALDLSEPAQPGN